MTKNMFPNSQEYFCYEDIPSWMYIVGKRGGSEFRIDRWDFMIKYDKQRVKLARELTPEEVYKMCLIESQYVEFEEVKEPLKQLT